MLIIFGGLPATGKTTIAKRLAQKLEATYLRIDSIEQAILKDQTVQSMVEVGAKGYLVAYAVALDNLKLGKMVVADSVNPIEITRRAWRDTALNAQVDFLEVEMICSDQVLHQQRVQTRCADIAGHRLPNWQDIQNREYEQWDTASLIIDTADISVDKAISMIMMRLNTEKSEEN